MSKIKSWRPMVAIQADPMDCAFACAATVLAMFGYRVRVQDLKAGASSRGTRLSELRDILRSRGADVSVVAFDPEAPSAIRGVSVALLRRGHYVVLGRRSGRHTDLYDPVRGWLRYTDKMLARELQGFAIEVRGVVRNPGDIGAEPSHLLLVETLRDGVRIVRTVRGAKIAAFALFAQALALTIPLVTAGSVNAALPGANTSVGSFATGLVLILLLGGLCSAISDIGIRSLTRSATLASGTWLFDKLTEKFEGSGEPIAASRAFAQYSALSTIQRFKTELVIRLGMAALLMVAGAVALCFISWWLAIAGIVAMVISIACDLALRRVMLHAGVAVVHSSLLVRTRFDSLVANIPALVRAGSVRAARAHFRQGVREHGLAGARLDVLNARRTFATGSTKVLENAVFTAIAGYFVVSGEYSLGAFVAVGLYKDQLANAIGALFALFREFEMLRPQRLLLDGLDTAPRAALPELTITHGRLTLANVSFTYGKAERPVLLDVNLDIEAGDLAVLMGETGSGKSTLLRIILGGERPSRGTIEVDGVDVGKVRLKGVGAILQSDRLIGGTIRENVAFYRNRVTDAEIYAALDLACAVDFARDLPLRLDTPVGDGVAGLSGGQRQRILLARALVRSPRLIVLDEATSSLDVDTERRIIQNIRGIGATVLICTHRPEVRELASAVLELRDGVLNTWRSQDMISVSPMLKRA